MLTEPFQDQPGMLSMLFGILRKDEDITGRLYWSRMLWKTSFAKCWNVAGIIVRPNGITRYWLWLYQV